MASKENKIFGKRSFLLVTGASKGLGRSIVCKFAEKLGPGSHILFTGRSKENLDLTKHLIDKNESLPPGVSTHSLQIDHNSASIDTHRDALNKVLTDNSLKINDFEQAIVVHNVGTLGDISNNVKDFKDSAELQSYWNLNLTDCAMVNSAFLEKFKPTKDLKVLVINITSLCSIQPFKSWGLYCSGKAARDMFFRVLAAEEPDIRVLNYAPGPLDTDMQKTARTDTGDTEVKAAFQDMANNGILLDPDVSAKKLIQILEINKFESGDHVDYFDVKDDDSS